MVPISFVYSFDILLLLKTNTEDYRSFFLVIFNELKSPLHFYRTTSYLPLMRLFNIHVCSLTIHIFCSFRWKVLLNFFKDSSFKSFKTLFAQRKYIHCISGDSKNNLCKKFQVDQRQAQILILRDLFQTQCILKVI